MKKKFNYEIIFSILVVFICLGLYIYNVRFTSMQAVKSHITGEKNQ